MKLLLFTLLLLFAGFGANASLFSIHHFNNDDGLPTNNFYTVFRDKTGFLWFGTDMGVVRFNGFSFEHFTTADGLADNEVFTIKEDFNGRIWMATYNGKLCYFENGKFYNERNKSFLKLPFASFNTTVINIEYDSSITILFQNKDHFVNIKNDSTEVLTIGDAEKAKETLYLKKESANSYLLYQKKGIFWFNKQHPVSRFEPYRNGKQFDFVTGNGNGFLLNGSDIYALDQELLGSGAFYLPHNTQMSGAQFLLHIYKKGEHLFAGTRNGMFITRGQHLFPGIIITGVVEDINQNYWITTYKNGIYKMDKPFKGVTVYDSVYQGNLLHTHVYNNGFYYYTSASDKLIRFNAGKKQVVSNDLNYLHMPIEMERWATFLVVNDSTYIHYSDMKEKLTLNINSGGKHFVQAYPDNRHGIADIYTDGHKVYGVDNRSIVQSDLDNVLQKKTEVLKFLFSSPDSKTRILGRAMDRDKHLWFSTDKFMYEIVGGAVVPQTYFRDIVLRKFGFYGDFMVGYDDRNILFAGKKTNGKYLLQPVKTDEYYAWGVLFPLDSAHLILTTNKYLLLLTLNAENPQQLYTLKPLPFSFIPQNTVFVYADTANCYFAKNGSLTAVPLRILYADAIPPKVAITRIRNYNTIFAVSPKIVFAAPDAKNISIDFTGLSFDNKKINYQYAIIETDGVDTNWQKIDAGTINFPTLGHGKYYLVFRANCGGNIYSKAAGIEIDVLKPFWLSWIFLTFVVILALLIIIFVVNKIFRRTLAKRRKEFDRDMKFYKAEYKALNALMNPHFIFNSLNNIQGLINSNNNVAANKFLVKFSRLVRQNMHNVDKGVVSLLEEIDLVNDYLSLECIRFQERISYTIDIDPEVEMEHIFIPPLLIQPIVENAIKHGILPKETDNGAIKITIQKQADNIAIMIADNGVGLGRGKYDSSEHHQSYGLENLRQRMGHNAFINDQVIDFSLDELLDDAGNVAGTLATVKVRDNIGRKQ